MQLLPLSLSIGILVGIWTWISGTFGLLTWPCLVGWALFILLGANKEAILKAILPIIWGTLLAFITASVLTAINASLIVTSLLFLILAFVVTFSMNISWLAAAPAGFCAVACFFAVGDPIKSVIPMICGVLLGFISFWVVSLFNKAESE